MDWIELLRQWLPEFLQGNPCAAWLLAGVALTIGLRLLNMHEFLVLRREFRALRDSSERGDDSSDSRS